MAIVYYGTRGQVLEVWTCETLEDLKGALDCAPEEAAEVERIVIDPHFTKG